MGKKRTPPVAVDVGPIIRKPGIYITPDFIGVVAPDGFVIDDTNYFRIQAEEEAKRFWKKARGWFAREVPRV